MTSAERRRRILEEAWVGDAVLALYARLRILRESGGVDAERFQRMTSNQFLS
jgi:23S rRNA maturation mini-RNase III